MRFSLIPRDEKFFDLLSEHIKGVQVGISLFRTIVEQWPVNGSEIAKLKDSERECDMTAHEILDKLNRTFVTPIDREDIHTLAKQIDDVIDLAYKVVLRMNVFGIKKNTPDLIDLVKILEEAVGIVVKAVDSIHDLKRPQRVLDYCIEINRFENMGDRVSERALLNLFSQEKDPLEVIKWKEIYDIVEDAIDTCEDIANTIESIVVKYS